MLRTGFTLIELLLAMFLSAALLVSSTFAWRVFSDKQTFNQGFDRLQASILFARNHALSADRTVSVCASEDGAYCSGLAYERGWIVFAENADGPIGRRNTDEPILSLQPALAERMSARASASLSPALSFSRHGRLSASGRIVLCLDNNPDYARALVFIRSGRMRIVTADEINTCHT